MKRRFQALQYALLLHDATGAKINGTGSDSDLDTTRRLAEGILKITPHAAYVDIHSYEHGTYAAQIIETVHQAGMMVVRRPAAVTPMETPSDPVEDLGDQPVPVDDPEAEIPVDQGTPAPSDESTGNITPGEQSLEAAAPRKRGRPAKVKSE